MTKPKAPRKRSKPRGAPKKRDKPKGDKEPTETPENQAMTVPWYSVMFGGMESDYEH